jgi:MAP7 domain-containing protein 1
LRGNVLSLKEWNEGYEDLEAIPFSFVVEFKIERKHWAMYADSEEDKVSWTLEKIPNFTDLPRLKYKVLGLLKVAAGL